jgi:septal ring factor EnvC (AmiA/AmiB activator)
MKWMIVLSILLGWPLYPVMSDLWAAEAKRVEKELSEKKEEYKRIKEKLRLKQEEKEYIQRKESSFRKRLDRTQKDLQKRKKVIKQKKVGLGQIKRRIRDTENDIFNLTRNVKQAEDKRSLGLQTLYKMSQVTSEAYLFGLSSSVDLPKMDRYLRVLIEHHARSTKTYKNELALKHSDEGKLARDRIQWQQSISEEEKRKEALRKLWNVEQAKLKSTVNQKATYEKSIIDMEKGSKAIRSLINKLERERRVLSYKKSEPRILKRKLRLPVHGKVVSLFKERGRNGIEIESSMGAPIRAILPGKVIYADWFKGFENLMIIDHGDEIFSVSGNCSKLLKKRGDTVSEGEIIAQIGSSESDGDSRLYFEIRHKGKPQDPLKWITGGKNKRP